MKKTILLMVAVVCLYCPLTYTQNPVVEITDHEAMLRSDGPQLKKNKRLIYDFWQVVVEGGHVELIDEYIAGDYIQHNPNFSSGVN